MSIVDVFFFQAEDGIRDRSPSRGLGDVYKRQLYGRTQRNEPSRFLREIEPEYIEETRSPVLEQRSRFGGWGDSYSDTVPGGASGYSGPSGWGRSAGGYGNGYSAGSRSGYLNRGDNAGCLLYTSPSPRDGLLSRMPASA